MPRAMRLLEAIVDANHRAVAGDSAAGLHLAEFAENLPLVALTCIDARLNRLLPNVLGVPPDQFIWLRNAGNIITGPLSSTIRSLSLACAIKGGKEVAIIGHTDCQVRKTSTMELIDRLAALGVPRGILPENITEYFGMFASERQNVIKAAEITRLSPLIGPKIPVHGLVVDIESGKLEFVVNGYQTLEAVTARWNAVAKSAGQTVDALKGLADFNIGEMHFPETKIGEVVTKAGDWLSEQVKKLEIIPEQKPKHPVIPVPPKIATPLELKRRLPLRKKLK
jgi:carbonic anhydrase